MSNAKTKTKLNHSARLIYWFVGIIVIILLIYFLCTMLDEAERRNISNNLIDI